MVHRWFRRSCVLVLSLCAALALGRPAGAARAASTPHIAASPIVRLAGGALRGRAVPGMQEFLGIPYAAPPVGPLRWEPPQPPAAWGGLRDATSFGPHCPQNPTPFGFASVSEDCLYLNVFAPAGAGPGSKLPVMVWIHGGGFTEGESDDYDPDRLVADGVVVVTLNYRLGYLGFLATSGLDAEKHTHVNYGLLDQQFALAWTRKNIASFGGNPGQTTIFGQSAGGESVFAQILSPGSAGLMSRAIIQSGAYGILSLPTLAAAETSGNAVATSLGCSPQDTTCLRGTTVSQILALESGSTPFSGGPSPAIDGTMIPESPALALATGSYNDVAVVQGANHDDFRLFTAELFDLAGGPLTAAEYPLVVQQSLTLIGLGADAPKVLAKYPLSKYASPDLAFSALATDAVFSTQAALTDLLLDIGVPLYAFEFSDENAPEDFLPPVSFPYGSAHASELQFIFDSFTRSAPKLSPAELRLAAAMVENWTQFAKTGSPNGPHVPYWPQYVVGVDDVESLVPPTARLFFNFDSEHKVSFWSGLFVPAAYGPFDPAHMLTLDTFRAAARSVRPRAHRRFAGSVR